MPSFIDIYYFGKPFQYLFLNYEEISQSKVVFHIKHRDTGEEDIILNSLLSGKGEELSEQIYGKDFFYSFENLFLYEYGFNLRNTLMRSEGVAYLNKQYADMCFYVLAVLVNCGGVLEE